MDGQTRTRFGRSLAGLPALRQQSENDFAAAVNEVSAFVRDRGRLPEPAARDRTEVRLGAWLAAQRAADRRGRLSAQRASTLQRVLGRGWSSPA
ncbi:helicase associated domain-containing protein [Sinomonas soli]